MKKIIITLFFFSFTLVIFLSLLLYNKSQLFKSKDEKTTQELSKEKVNDNISSILTPALANPNDREKFKIYINKQSNLSFQYPEKFTVFSDPICSEIFLNKESKCFTSLRILPNTAYSVYLPPAKLWLVKNLTLDMLLIPGEDILQNKNLVSEIESLNKNNDKYNLSTYAYTITNKPIIKIEMNKDLLIDFDYYIVPDYERNLYVVLRFPRAFQIKCGSYNKDSLKSGCEEFINYVAQKYEDQYEENPKSIIPICDNIDDKEARADCETFADSLESVVVTCDIYEDKVEKTECEKMLNLIEEKNREKGIDGTKYYNPCDAFKTEIEKAKCLEFYDKFFKKYKERTENPQSIYSEGEILEQYVKEVYSGLEDIIKTVRF
ncbi:MAG: hypothetical protein KatS3mg090_0423 [Patescibacteria group bacterium]|nr:MAG: hypothetical protein KatS3mg090_0423 [Patescibacteria group bacterium]